MKIFLKAILGVAVWMAAMYVYAVKISGSNAGVNMFVFFLSLFLFILYILWITGSIEMWMTQIQRDRLLKNGLPAKGKIISCTKTGLKITANADFPRYGTLILLEAETAEGEKFQAETKIMLTESEFTSLAGRKSISIHYDPANRSKIAID